MKRNDADIGSDPSIETPRRKLRALLAEDDLETRRLVGYVLRMEDYVVSEASDGLALMEYLAAALTGDLEPPDLIVSDIRMPGFTGLDVLRSSTRHGLDAPLLLMSAFCDDATRSEAARHGAVGLLEKPLDVDALIETLAALHRKIDAGE